MTPETLKAIQDEAERYAIEQGRNPDTDPQYFKQITAHFIAGCALYAEQLEEVRKENERLKGLVKEQWDKRINLKYIEIDKEKVNYWWEQYCESNSL